MSRTIIITLLIVTCLIGFKLFSGPSTVPKPTVNPIEQPIPVPQQQSPITPSHRVNPLAKSQQPLRESPNEWVNHDLCIAQSDYDNDPRHLLIEQFFKERYFDNGVDYINYLNEPDLNQLAQDGNVRAMYILGLNYRWYAKMENFRSDKVRPPELTKPIYKEKPLDKNLMNRARYWLVESALNGKLNALTEISVSYFHEAYLLEQQQTPQDQEVQRLRLNAQAYLALHDWIAPELSNNSNYDVSDAARPQFNSILDNLKAGWANARERLGFDTNIILDLPEEYYQLEALEQQICPSACPETHVCGR